MNIFDPQLDTQLHIGASVYEFLPLQLLPGDAPGVCMLEGQEGFIYALRNLEQGTLWALKVLKPAYRSEHIAHVTAALAAYKDVGGFYLCNRVCFTRSTFEALITTCPALEYAILMPWLDRKTWAGLLRSPQASQEYTRMHALNLAYATARALCELERRGHAHTDIAGGNIFCTPDFKQVELLDLEGVYISGTSAPRRLSYGSPGYQHHRPGRQGQWSPYGDRFAGAMLLTEMLTWWSPVVRATVPKDALSLFLPEELQKRAGTRWPTVRDLLWSLSPALLDLFDQAWTSSRLKDCPAFSTWYMCLERIRFEDQRSAWPSVRHPVPAAPADVSFPPAPATVQPPHATSNHRSSEDK